MLNIFDSKDNTSKIKKTGPSPSLNQGKKLALVLIGPPGSGKSTFINELKTKFNDIVIHSTDDKFIDPKTGIYKYQRDKLDDYHALVQKEALMNMQKGTKIIALDNKYGKIICACNTISEGEVVDCIRRPLGARTVQGVKRRTGAGFGSCQGSYCNEKIINILSRELNKKVTEIVDDSKKSKVVLGRIKEFGEV
jgi:bacterioferritin-associated ferredoxin